METLLYIHIISASLGLISGAVALIRRKGSAPHKQAGRVFIGTMLIMALTAVVLSAAKGKHFDMLSSILTCYMITTAVFVFRRSPRGADPAGYASANAIRIGLMLPGILCLFGYLYLELSALGGAPRVTDAPAGVGFVFAAVLTLALAGDMRFFSASATRQKRVVRHLWRMNFGLLLATASFFGARPHLFPDWMQSSGLLVLLSFLPIILMAFWALRVKLQPAVIAAIEVKKAS